MTYMYEDFHFTNQFLEKAAARGFTAEDVISAFNSTLGTTKPNHGEAPLRRSGFTSRGDHVFIPFDLGLDRCIRPITVFTPNPAKHFDSEKLKRRNQFLRRKSKRKKC